MLLGRSGYYTESNMLLLNNLLENIQSLMRFLKIKCITPGQGDSIIFHNIIDILLHLFTSISCIELK